MDPVTRLGCLVVGGTCGQALRVHIDHIGRKMLSLERDAGNSGYGRKLRIDLFKLSACHTCHLIVSGIIGQRIRQGNRDTDG